jgi:hypothetical protein
MDIPIDRMENNAEPLSKMITNQKADQIVREWIGAWKHHNHGTKFRLRQDRLPDLYGQVRIVI